MKRNWLKWFNRIVYSTTKKPKRYVEVQNSPTSISKLFADMIYKNRKTLQNARQLQYNRWCKRYHIYSGSYLPENPEDLTSKGWTLKKISDDKGLFFQRKSDNQTIRYDYEKPPKPNHYHRYIWWKKYFGKKTMIWFKDEQFKNDRSTLVYYNSYGKKTCMGEKDHHIPPTIKKEKDRQ